MRAAQFIEPRGAEVGEPLIVDAVSTALAHVPGGPVAVPGVVLGTLLRQVGAAVGGWLPVRVAGYAEPLWARTGDLAAVPSRPPTGAEVLAVARRVRGAAYVWGGLSTLGIDCSGLVHLAWRRFGVRLPRDAHEQSAATTAVPRGDERPGDLFFFARTGKRVHHVGILVAPGRILHASPGLHQVVEESLPPERAETLIGAHRV
jgi:cell wall-associated NlpC family hydrolase